MYQRIVIDGNLGADPELRYTPSGTAYTRFSVAVDRKWHDGEGKLQQETTWYRVTAWGRQAEPCHQYLAKGRRVLVEGSRVYASAYLTRENQAAATLELTASRVQFLDSARQAAPEAEDEELELEAA